MFPKIIVYENNSTLTSPILFPYILLRISMLPMASQFIFENILPVGNSEIGRKLLI